MINLSKDRFFYFLQKPPNHLVAFVSYLQNGVPEWIRTTDLRFRKPLLYPTELRKHDYVLYHVV